MVLVSQQKSTSKWRNSTTSMSQRHPFLA